MMAFADISNFYASLCGFLVLSISAVKILVGVKYSKNFFPTKQPLFFIGKASQLPAV